MLATRYQEELKERLLEVIQDILELAQHLVCLKKMLIAAEEKN